MTKLNNDIAKIIATNYCVNNTLSDYNYIVVGRNEKPDVPYYLYELLLADNDEIASNRPLEEGEYLVKVFDNNSKAEVLISHFNKM